MSEKEEKEIEGSEITPSLPVTNLSLPEIREDNNGNITNMKFTLVQKENEFIEAIDKICDLFQSSYYPICRSFAHYIGFVRGRTTEDILDRGKVLFQFIDDDILGKEIKEVTKKLLIEAYEDFKKTDKASEYFYEFIIEFGRKEDDFIYDEETKSWTASGAAYDYFPLISQEETERRLKLYKEKMTKEIILQREKMSKELDITVQLKEICNKIEETLKENDNEELRKRLEYYKKNIEAIETYSPLKKVDMNFMSKTLPKNIRSKINVLALKVNNIFRKDDKSDKNFFDIIEKLEKIIGTEKAIDIILRYLIFVASNHYHGYKIFCIKFINDMIRLRFNLLNDYGKNIIKKLNEIL